MQNHQTHGNFKDFSNEEFEAKLKENVEDNYEELTDGQLKLFIGGLNYLSLKSNT